MKLFLTGFLLVATGIALADTNRDIYDVMYLPNAGTTYGISDLTYQSVKAKSRSTNPDVKFKGIGFSQSIGHAFTDKFSLQASLDYVRLTDDRDTRGISDPSFLGRYRVMDQRFRVDVVGGGLVSVGDRKVQSNGKDNHLLGGSLLQGGVEVGQKKPNYQWSIGGLYTRHLKSQTDYNSPQNQDYETDAYNTWDFRADVLNKLLEATFLRTHASVYLQDSFRDDQNYKAASATTYEFGTELQQKLLPDLLLRAGVNYLSVSTRSAQYERYDGLTFNAGATYQF